MADEPKTLSAQDARQGKELGVMRYVLHISLALAVLAASCSISHSFDR